MAVWFTVTADHILFFMTNHIKCIKTENIYTHIHVCSKHEGLEEVKAETHSACSAQR